MAAGASFHWREIIAASARFDWWGELLE